MYMCIFNISCNNEVHVYEFYQKTCIIELVQSSRPGADGVALRFVGTGSRVGL